MQETPGFEALTPTLSQRERDLSLFQNEKGTRNPNPLPEGRCTGNPEALPRSAIYGYG
jgi:hypothetical protein